MSFQLPNPPSSGGALNPVDIAVAEAQAETFRWYVIPNGQVTDFGSGAFGAGASNTLGNGPNSIDRIPRQILTPLGIGNNFGFQANMSPAILRGSVANEGGFNISFTCGIGSALGVNDAAFFGYGNLLNGTNWLSSPGVGSNYLGVGFDRNSTNWQLCVKAAGAATVTTTDLGVAKGTSQILCANFSCNPNDSQILASVTFITGYNTLNAAAQAVSLTAGIPAASTSFSTFQCIGINDAAASIVLFMSFLRVTYPQIVCAI